MRRTIIVIMMFYAMLNCIADISVTQSMYLPSQNVVAEFMAVESYGGLFGEDVKKAVEKATKNGNAYTGVLRVGDNSVVHWDEGGEPVVTETESRISINYFKIGDKVKIPNNVSNVAFYWHTHPKRGESNLSSHGSSKPSEADKKFQKDMQQSGYKGNAFIIGLRENKVTFYNKNKNIITIPYPVFVNLGNR